jgi:hypothetical protein
VVGARSQIFLMAVSDRELLIERVEAGELGPEAAEAEVVSIGAYAGKRLRPVRPGVAASYQRP